MILSIISILILIISADIIFLRIPNCLNYLLFVYSFIFIIWYGIDESILGSFTGLIIFFMCYLLSKGLLGEGDIKLIPSLGLLTGYPDILYLILCSALSSLLVLFVHKKRKAQVLPFAPFLVISFILVQSYKVVLSNLP